MFLCVHCVWTAEMLNNRVQNPNPDRIDQLAEALFDVVPPAREAAGEEEEAGEDEDEEADEEEEEEEQQQQDASRTA